MTTPKKIEDGGPAFPHMAADGHPDYRLGLTVRDWFAGQALAGFIPALSFANEESLKKIAKENGLHAYVTNAQIAASVAYGYADAMLAASKTGEA